MKLHSLLSILTIGALCLSITLGAPQKRNIRSAEELQFGNQQNIPGSMIASGIPQAAMSHGQKYHKFADGKSDMSQELHKDFQGLNYMNERDDEDIDREPEEPLALPFYDEALSPSMPRFRRDSDHSFRQAHSQDGVFHEGVEAKDSASSKEIEMARAARNKRYKRNSKSLDLDSLSEEEFFKLLSIMRDYLKAEENLAKEKPFTPESYFEDIPLLQSPQDYRRDLDDRLYIPNLEELNELSSDIPYDLSNFNNNRMKKSNYGRDDIGYIPLPGQKRSFFSRRPGLPQYNKRRTLNEGQRVYALASMMAKNKGNQRSLPVFLPAAV